MSYNRFCLTIIYTKVLCRSGVGRKNYTLTSVDEAIDYNELLLDLIESVYNHFVHCIFHILPIDMKEIRPVILTPMLTNFLNGAGKSHSLLLLPIGRNFKSKQNVIIQ